MHHYGGPYLPVRLALLPALRYDVTHLTQRPGDLFRIGQSCGKPVPGESLFRVTTGHITLLRPKARLMRPYVHPLNVADFKGIRAG